jgi:hypothetical protein
MPQLGRSRSGEADYQPRPPLPQSEQYKLTAREIVGLSLLHILVLAIILSGIRSVRGPGDVCLLYQH